CNVLTVRALAARGEAIDGNWRAIAFDPGPTPGTGLLRDTPLAMRAAWRLLSIGARFLPRFNKAEAVGTILAHVAPRVIPPPAGEYYVRVVRDQPVWTAPSELARRDDVRDALWKDSADLLDIRS